MYWFTVPMNGIDITQSHHNTHRATRACLSSTGLTHCVKKHFIYLFYLLVGFANVSLLYSEYAVHSTLLVNELTRRVMTDKLFYLGCYNLCMELRHTIY